MQIDEFTDVTDEVENGLATITINRPDEWGLVNKVVPAADLTAEAFNTDTEHFAGIGQMVYSALKLFGESEEAQEGITAFHEKRKPDFASYRTH